MVHGRVVQHHQRLLLSDAKFVVREGGRQRVLREKRKNVHAFIVGYLVDSRGIFGADADTKRDFPVRITYNPYRAGAFLTESGAPVFEARGVLLNERGVSACYLS